SVLPRILSSAGPMPAKHAHNGEALVPNCIYVARPDHHLLLHESHIRVIRGPRENGHRPAIDPLFRTAAYTYGPRVIGVVLSGALDDGTAGLIAIKNQGGLAVVQDPNDALVDGRPRSAVRAGEAGLAGAADGDPRPRAAASQVRDAFRRARGRRRGAGADGAGRAPARRVAETRRRPRRVGCSSGNVRTKIAPPRERLAARMLPPNRSMVPAASQRPRPVPREPLVVKNGSKRRAWTEAGSPVPSSDTVTTSAFFSRRAATVTVPPSGIASRALRSRLTNSSDSSATDPRSAGRSGIEVLTFTGAADSWKSMSTSATAWATMRSSRTADSPTAPLRAKSCNLAIISDAISTRSSTAWAPGHGSPASA